MRAPTLAAGLLCASTLVGATGCSLMSLDRFPYPHCPQSECEPLNVRDGIDSATACRLWLCDPRTQECVLGARDEDGDGHPPLRCEGDDCDDASSTTFAGAPESCNGTDDDCNGWIDDAAGPPEGPTPVLAAAEPDWTSFTATASGLATAYDSGAGAGLEVVRGPTAIDPPSDPLTLASTVTPFLFDTSAIADGCALAVPTPHPLARCGVGDTCTGGQFCFLSRGGDMLCDSRLLASPPAGQCNSDAECDDGVFCNGREACQPGNPMSDSFGCRPNVAAACATGETCSEDERACVVVNAMLASCTIADLSIARAADEWIAAAISTVPCGTGALRLGHFVDEARTPASRYPLRDVAQRGDARGARSTSWLGVELDGGADCPGGARDAGEPAGASGPAIAALAADAASGRRRPQALVAYLAAPSCRATGSCGGSPPPGASGPVEVELVGAWLEEGSAGGATIAWMNASAPSRPGTSTSATTTRPALVAWVSGDRAGYVVAYGREAGGIGVHLVPALADPAPVCDGSMTPPCLVDVAPFRTHLSMSDRRVPIDLPPSSEETFFSSATPIGDVAIAVGASSATSVELALAWAEATEVVLARATLDPATGTLTAGPLERFASMAAGHVSITHVERGLVRPGAVLDGSEVDPSLLGGWVAMWHDGEGTRAVRVADYDGMPIAPGAARVLSGSVWPRAFVDAGGRLRGVAHQAGNWVVLPSVCGM